MKRVFVVIIWFAYGTLACHRLEDINWNYAISSRCTQGIYIIPEGVNQEIYAVNITKSVYGYKYVSNVDLHPDNSPYFRKLDGQFGPCENYEKLNGESGNCFATSGLGWLTGGVDQNICFLTNVCPEVPPSCDPNAEECSPSCNPDIECCELGSPSNKCSTGKDLGN